MPTSDGLVVLVVEDESLIRWSVAEVLTARGHRVIEAADAAAARHVINGLSEPIDVILLDYRLPDSDDLRLLADIRRRSPRSAVVMMTAFGTDDLREGAIGLGVHAVIDKPFDIDIIDPLVRHAHADHH